LPILHAVVLGLLQGLGEFLPISSSAHLLLVPWMLKWPPSGLEFDVALHMGTLIAVTVYFWRDLVNLVVEGLTKGTRTPTGRMAWGIVIGTIPALVVGLLFENVIEEIFRQSYVTIALLLAFMGVVLYLVDRSGAKRRTLSDFRVIDGLWMGIGQSLALFPGFSRSGTTITAGLLLGYTRESAAKASFLLGWPAIAGAGILALKDMPAGSVNAAFITGVLVSAISGYAVIAFLMDYLKRGTFLVFAVYRLAIAALAIFLFFLR
jgi:undecaprenyl-diphosphatase